MSHSAFVPLVDALGPWFERPQSEIPELLRLRIKREFSPHTWDSLAPDQRRGLASRVDYLANPATEAERTRAWELGCEITETEKRLSELTNTNPISVSEIAIKRQLLAQLSVELARLHRRGDGLSNADQHDIASSAAASGRARISGLHEGQNMTNQGGAHVGRDGGLRTTYDGWLDESRYDGWFTRLNHQAFNEDLIEFVCCYPDGDRSAVARNRDRIQVAMIDVFACQDAPCEDADVPTVAREAFREKFDERVKRLKTPLPKDECALNLLVWNSGFPGEWRPDAAESGDQTFGDFFGYQCRISARGKLRWEQPRFMPGRDYDGTFRGSEHVTKCRLEVVRAIAEYRHEETGRMLNPDLFAALADLSEHDNPANAAKPLGNSAKGEQEKSAAVVNRIRTRDDVLSPAIRSAQSKALEPLNYLSVWAELLKLAKSSTPPTPIVGHNAEDAICWNDADGVTQSFTKNALRGRFDRAAGKYQRGRKQTK